MKNIILIGMTGTGKTTIAKKLSTELNGEFIDIDKIIETKYNMSIENIFSKEGEQSFREKESNIINNLKIFDKLNIISTGGGIVKNIDNIKVLKDIGIIFLLEGSIDAIIKNLKNDNINSRPLLKNKDLRETLKNMHDERYENYLNSSNYIINIDNKSIDEIVREIINIMKENHSCS